VGVVAAVSAAGGRSLSRIITVTSAPGPLDFAVRKLIAGHLPVTPARRRATGRAAGVGGGRSPENKAEGMTLVNVFGSGQRRAQILRSGAHVFWDTVQIR